MNAFLLRRYSLRGLHHQPRGIQIHHRTNNPSLTKRVVFSPTNSMLSFSTVGQDSTENTHMKSQFDSNNVTYDEPKYNSLKIVDEISIPGNGRKSELQGSHYILDCRSPSEYKEDHAPCALNWYSLNDEERVKIGTMYKNHKFEAKLEAASLITRNISNHLAQNKHILKPNTEFTLYCARGGQRSHSLAIVLNRIGFKVNVLRHGYKSYRQQVLKMLESFSDPDIHVVVINGPTGCGKTRILNKIKELGHKTLDIEKAAKHFGSILGGGLEHDQMSTKCFHSSLFEQLSECGLHRSKSPIFVEGESGRIGKFYLPSSINARLKGKDPSAASSTTVVHLIHENIDLRVHLIRSQYHHLEMPEYREKLLEHVRKLQGMTKNSFPELFHQSKDRWVDMASNEQFHQLAKELIQYHYDPAYFSCKKRTWYTDGKYREDVKHIELPCDEPLTEEEGISKIAKRIIEKCTD